MDLKSVGLGLGCVLFHSGWELVEWVSKSIDLGENSVEILEICDDLKTKNPRLLGLKLN